MSDLAEFNLRKTKFYCWFKKKCW